MQLRRACHAQAVFGQGYNGVSSADSRVVVLTSCVVGEICRDVRLNRCRLVVVLLLVLVARWRDSGMMDFCPHFLKISCVHTKSGLYQPYPSCQLSATRSGTYRRTQSPLLQ